MHQDDQEPSQPWKIKAYRHFNFIRDEVAQGNVSITYLSTEDMLADIMTKGLPSPTRHQSLTTMLGMILGSH
jgi:hypothetical protein